MAKKAIGIDLGGTDIKAGVVDESGKILCKVRIPAEAKKDRMTVIGNIARAADLARCEAGLTWRGIAAVGLGSPGVFEPPNGIVHHCANIKCLEGKPLARPVAGALGHRDLEVALDNDANVAAFAEAWIGAGRGKSTLVLMTLGTGIGGGIVLNGEVWRGAWGAAAELGHQIVEPREPDHGSGTAGALEDFGSATALVRRFHEAVGAGKRTLLAARMRKGDTITARDITLAAKAGDRTCLWLIEETGKYLGIAVTNMLHILNVELVVFTGGMTAAGAVLLRPIRAEVRRRAFSLARRNVKILFSRLGNDAGLIGAAGQALKQAEAKRRAKRTAR